MALRAPEKLAGTAGLLLCSAGPPSGQADSGTGHDWAAHKPQGLTPVCRAPMGTRTQGGGIQAPASAPVCALTHTLTAVHTPHTRTLTPMSTRTRPHTHWSKAAPRVSPSPVHSRTPFRPRGALGPTRTKLEGRMAAQSRGGSGSLARGDEGGPWGRREGGTRVRTTRHSYAGCALHKSRAFQQV